jgi:hypothetical protein
MTRRQCGPAQAGVAVDPEQHVDTAARANNQQAGDVAAMAGVSGADRRDAAPPSAATYLHWLTAARLTPIWHR